MDSKQRRKQCLLPAGSKKLKRFCIAEVTLRKRLSDGLCLVTVQEPHVGHSIRDDGKMLHVYLSRAEKEWITGQLLNGVPKDKILEKITLNCDIDASANHRLSTLSLKDIDSFATSWKADAPFIRVDDPAHVDAFVSQHADSILYYKKRDERDTKFNILNDGDFVVVYQTAFQKTILFKYGHEVVVFDGIRGLNPYNFAVHSLLVVDAENEGFAVAFLVSNRSDQTVLEVFVACVRDNCGIINTTTLMSDVDNVCYDAWQGVMGPPKLSVFCTWHVREAWKENLQKLIKTGAGDRKMSQVERRRVTDLVKRQLFDLADDLDQASFTGKLKSFLSLKDPVVQPFLDYFRKNYVTKNNIDAWASCYRVHAGLNINTHVESFRRTLKYNITKKKEVGAVAACLHHLDYYVKQRTRQYLGKNNHPKITSKLTSLLERHLAAEKYVNEQPLIVQFDEDLQAWQVNSFTPSKDGVVEMYYVQKNETVECVKNSEGCMLSCLTCRSCFHEYKCSCWDSAVQTNMCEHIHALCLFFKLQDASAENEATVSVLDEVEDVTVIEEMSGELPLIVESVEEQVLSLAGDADGASGKAKVVSDIKKAFSELASSLIENVTDENFQDWYTLSDLLIPEFLSTFQLLGKNRRQRQQL